MSACGSLLCSRLLAAVVCGCTVVLHSLCAPQLAGGFSRQVQQAVLFPVQLSGRMPAVGLFRATVARAHQHTPLVCFAAAHAHIGASPSIQACFLVAGRTRSAMVCGHCDACWAPAASCPFVALHCVWDRGRQLVGARLKRCFCRLLEGLRGSKGVFGVSRASRGAPARRCVRCSTSQQVKSSIWQKRASQLPVAGANSRPACATPAVCAHLRTCMTSAPCAVNLRQTGRSCCAGGGEFLPAGQVTSSSTAASAACCHALS